MDYFLPKLYLTSQSHSHHSLQAISGTVKATSGDSQVEAIKRTVVLADETRIIEFRTSFFWMESRA